MVIPGVPQGGKEVGLGEVPGKGCRKDSDFYTNGVYNGNNNGWGSWSNPPSDLTGKRGCLYNRKLGDDAGSEKPPYLNHTLHEFGHALGFVHEHERKDVDPACKAPGYGGSVTSYLTPYDRKSVMHYQFLAWGTNGNYGYTGLSDWDVLGTHILYPENGTPAEFVGATVVRSTGSLNLASAWKVRGAFLSFVANSFVWSLNGQTVSSSAELSIKAPGLGVYSLQYSHKDFLGRNYTYQGTVRVLTPAEFDRQAAGVVAAVAALL